MGRFVEGDDRRQGILLPEYLDEYVSGENPVRVIDVFVDELELGGLAPGAMSPETDRSSGGGSDCARSSRRAPIR